MQQKKTFRYLDFYVNLIYHVVSLPQVWRKRDTRKVFMGGGEGRIYGEGYMERLMIRS